MRLIDWFVQRKIETSLDQFFSCFFLIVRNAEACAYDIEILAFTSSCQEKVFEGIAREGQELRTTFVAGFPIPLRM
jgi:hypothetical protein